MAEQDSLWIYYKHIFPDFTENHFTVYLLLLHAEPKSAAQLINETGFGRATVYRFLNELIAAGLVKKSVSCGPVFSAHFPMRSYFLSSRKVIARLNAGRVALRRVLEESSGIENELCLVKRDDGVQKLIDRSTRTAIKNELQLREIKKAVESQLFELEGQKMKSWVVYR